MKEVTKWMFSWPLMVVYLAYTAVLFIVVVPLLVVHAALGVLVAKVGGFDLEEPIAVPEVTLVSPVGDNSWINSN